ncbi:hypothetical protein [Aquipuribacter hungaricus]|uniref:Uncharacterized protein n=2 Tax=Aquipuribacter hungaricus TaxID=545624 RepID=A0ABV7WIX3_9MICO
MSTPGRRRAGDRRTAAGRRTAAERRTAAGRPTPPGPERVLAPAGLVLVGAGLTVAMDASARRARARRVLGWVLEGTVGLLLVGSGLSVFGDAVRRTAQRPA